jgi:hypothetical protein
MEVLEVRAIRQSKRLAILCRWQLIGSGPASMNAVEAGPVTTPTAEAAPSLTGYIANGDRRGDSHGWIAVAILVAGQSPGLSCAQLR